MTEHWCRAEIMRYCGIQCALMNPHCVWDVLCSENEAFGEDSRSRRKAYPAYYEPCVE